MKKKSIYIIISTLTLAVTLLSCSNLLDKTPAQDGQITITLNTPGRTVSPATAADITAITEWDVTVTQDTTEVLKEKLPAQNGSISIQLPAGTYTFSVEGTAAGTDGNSDVTFTGSAENVPVNSQTASVSIVVYPKKTENGTGDFSYIINFADEINTEGIQVTLTQINNPAQQPEVKIKTDGTTITLEASSVPSGFYLLSVTYYDQAFLLGDELIEICDGATTTGTAENVEFIKETDPYVSATGTGDGSRPWLPGKIIDFVDAVEDAIPTPEVDLIYVDKSIPPIAFTDRTKDGTVIIGFFSNDNPSVTRYKCTLSVSSGTTTLSIDAAHLAEQGGITVAKGNQIELLETTLSDGETIVLTLDEASPPALGDTIISKNCTEEIAQRFLVGDGSQYKISSSGTLIRAESPYAAWNQQRVLYVDNTAANLISASSPAVAMTDFCFDWDNNIYVCTSNQEIVKIPQGETYTEATPMPLTGPTNTVSIACDNGNLYVLECSEEQPPTVRLWQYKCADFDGTETSVSGTPIELSASGLDLSDYIPPVIAAADSTIYLAAPYTADNTWKVYAWTINDDGTTITAEQKYSSDVDLLSSTGLTVSTAGGSSVDWSTFRVSDLLVQDGAVYALLSEVSSSFETISGTATSRGAVVKLTDTGSALSVDTNFGSKGLLGWTNTAQQFNYAYEEAYTGEQVSGTVDCYWPASDNTNGFYGPTKFVAVKPKKLVIADDGATGIPYNKSELSSTTGEIYQKNRIVEVDLSSGAISKTASFTEDQLINFDISVSGGSYWFMQPM